MQMLPTKRLRTCSLTCQKFNYFLEKSELYRELSKNFMYNEIILFIKGGCNGELSFYCIRKNGRNFIR